MIDDAEAFDRCLQRLREQPPDRREQSLKAIESVDPENAKLLTERLKDEPGTKPQD